jgi:phosphate transport system permease protein
MKREEMGPRQTRRWVIVADKTADKVITIGGIMVIAAVLGILVFLVYEVIPLFRGGAVISHWNYHVDLGKDPIVGLATDENNVMAAAVNSRGRVFIWHIESGALLGERCFDLQGKDASSFAMAEDNTNLAFGFQDGTIRFGKLAFKSDIIPVEKIPSDIKKLNESEGYAEESVFKWNSKKEVRKTSLELGLEEAVNISPSLKPIMSMGYQFSDFGEKPRRNLAAVDSDGNVLLVKSESKLNLLTRKSSSKISITELGQLPIGFSIVKVLVNDTSDTVFVAEKDGRVYRYGATSDNKSTPIETTDLLPSGIELESMGILLGGQSFVVGASDGTVNIFFLVEDKKRVSAGPLTLVQSKSLEPHSSSVIDFGASRRGKGFVTADASGNVWMRHGTSETTLIKLSVDTSGGPVKALVISPRFDGLLSLSTKGSVNFWRLDIPHPEISFRTLFGKVWYEGYPEPSYTWQSSGATDAFEPKLSIVPLIFGTIKATFYSLCFAIPIALLAAIYTSEFLTDRARGKIKPVMEVMASIPSVALGFVAALVLAPVVEKWTVFIIAAFIITPISLVSAACLWQLLPPSFSVRVQGSVKMLLILLVAAFALMGAYHFEHFFERAMFGGNFKSWLNKDVGSPIPMLALFLSPFAALLVGLVGTRSAVPRISSALGDFPGSYPGFFDLFIWVSLFLATALISCIAAWIAAKLGFDTRGTLVDTYVQRNTLIVSFAVGFAVIPIIYTVAEDALNAVPEHLRSASLGCGATPWQTAVWIILPTAISGIFSAVMIGMGRAVGETMIMVMAAGNTPLMDINIFDGLRSLSANIAVELPEAPKDGSLYRVLFLTALVLFGMTFTINTVAEMVRLRFRKRATQL